MTCLFVPGAAAGNKPQSRVVNGAVNGLGRKTALGKSSQGVYPVSHHAAVSPGNKDFIARFNFAEIGKNGLTVY